MFKDASSNMQHALERSHCTCSFRLITTVLSDNPGLIHVCHCNALQQAQNPLHLQPGMWQGPCLSDEAPLLATKWIDPIVWLRCRSPAVKLLSQLCDCSARHRPVLLASSWTVCGVTVCAPSRSQVSFSISVSSSTVSIAFLGSGCSTKMEP